MPPSHTNEIEEILSGQQPIAIIIRSKSYSPGIEFVTPDEYSQQLALMSHPTGTSILPHIHNSVPREVTYTQEVLIIRSGRLRVDFYADEKSYLESRILESGDVLQLISGGHGFEVLQDVEMIEIKQGPYIGDKDKTRFDKVLEAEVIVLGK